MILNMASLARTRAPIAFQRAFKMPGFVYYSVLGLWVTYVMTKSSVDRLFWGQKSLTGYLVTHGLLVTREVKTTFHDRRLKHQSHDTSALTPPPHRCAVEGSTRREAIRLGRWDRPPPSGALCGETPRCQLFPWRLLPPQTHPPHPRSAVLTAWNEGDEPSLTMCAGTARRVRTGGVWERVKGRGTPRVRERGVEGCTRL
jgi:hypothetical protein